MKNLQTIKHSAQKGFTLIELMIVVAIIGILAALAIPAYQDYTIKSRVGEGASLSGAYKTALEIYWSENATLGGVALTDNSINPVTLGLTAVEAEYVSSILIQIESGRPQLEVQLKTLSATTGKLGGAVADGGADAGCFRYVPTPSGGAGSNLQWTVVTTNCTNALPTKFLPRT
jgi:type IV pilus assembly protein PilA